MLVKNEKKLSVTQLNMYGTEVEGIATYTTRLSLKGLILSYE